MRSVWFLKNFEIDTIIDEGLLRISSASSLGWYFVVEAPWANIPRPYMFWQSRNTHLDRINGSGDSIMLFACSNHIQVSKTD